MWLTATRAVSGFSELTIHWAKSKRSGVSLLASNRGNAVGVIQIGEHRVITATVKPVLWPGRITHQDTSRLPGTLQVLA